SQPARQKALARFKAEAIKVLVATDIAARGIDVDSLHLVINYDLPNEPETYVHRIGRTGRAGASGRAWSFCDVEEREYLWQIQQLIGFEVEQVADHPFPVTGDVSYAQPRKSAAPAANTAKRRKKKRNARR